MPDHVVPFPEKLLKIIATRQGRNVGLKSGGTNSGEDNVASLGTQAV